MTILMCAQKLTEASLIYRTVPKTKTSKMKKLKNKRICSEETVPGKKPWKWDVNGPERTGTASRLALLPPVDTGTPFLFGINFLPKCRPAN